MRCFIILIVLTVLSIPKPSSAQSASVEFRAFVFDGALSLQESKKLADRVAAVPEERRATERVRLTLTALRSTRSQLASGSLHFSAITDKVARQRFESEHVLIEARVVLSGDTMDYSVGAAYVDGNSNLSCSCMSKRQGFAPGEHILSTSSTDSLHIVLIQSTSDEKALPVQLPKDFGNQFRLDRIPKSKGGISDITMR